MRAPQQRADEVRRRARLVARQPRYEIRHCACKILRLSSLLAALLIALLLPVNLPAQSTALLTGTVVDPSGAVIPGARVACTNAETGLQSQAVANTAGLFRFPGLPVGIYELTLSREGFSTLVRGGIQLLTGQTDLWNHGGQPRDERPAVERRAPCPAPLPKT